jgi:PAS domain S-box-containing protein
MEGSTDQVAGAVFRALASRGHGEVERAIIDAYAATSDPEAGNRERFSRTMFAQTLDALDSHLDGEEQVEVLTAAFEDLVDRFSAVIDAAPVAICAVDGEGRVQIWNPAAAETFGSERSNALERPFPSVWRGEGADDVRSYLDRLRSGEQVSGEAVRHRRSDGSVVDTRVWGAPLYDDGFEGAAFVVLDVTARREQRQRLSVLNRVLRHNVRNDVNVVRGYVEELSDRLPDDTDTDSHLDIVRERLDDIIELSDTARRIERVADTDRSDTIRIDVSDLLCDRIGRLERAYPACEVRATLPDDVPVRGHELLPHALDNVLENAVEHNDSDDPRVTIDLISPPCGDRIVVQIADNGPGLPPVEQRVLQTDEETQLTHSDGLGLWLANWIVRGSGGRIDVDTSTQGTSVLLELPAA